MKWLIAILVLYLLGCGYLRLKRSGETRMVRCATITASPQIVFDLVSNVDRMPDWYRRPQWLPRPFQVSTLSLWGESIPSAWRFESGSGEISDEVQIRLVRNREFGYRHTYDDGSHYESIFRISPQAAGCQLTWEVRYQMRRWLDLIVNQSARKEEIFKGMGQSLQSIRRQAEALAVESSGQKSASLAEEDEPGECLAAPYVQD